MTASNMTSGPPQRPGGKRSSTTAAASGPPKRGRPPLKAPFVRVKNSPSNGLISIMKEEPTKLPILQIYMAHLLHATFCQREPFDEQMKEMEPYRIERCQYEGWKASAEEPEHPCEKRKRQLNHVKTCPCAINNCPRTHKPRNRKKCKGKPHDLCNVTSSRENNCALYVQLYAHYTSCDFELCPICLGGIEKINDIHASVEEINKRAFESPLWENAIRNNPPKKSDSAASTVQVSSSQVGLISTANAQYQPSPAVVYHLVPGTSAQMHPSMIIGQMPQMPNGTYHNSTTHQVITTTDNRNVSQMPSSSHPNYATDHQYPVERSSSTHSSNYSAPSSNQPPSYQTFNQQPNHTFNNESHQPSNQSTPITYFDKSGTSTPAQAWSKQPQPPSFSQQNNRQNADLSYSAPQPYDGADEFHPHPDQSSSSNAQAPSIEETDADNADDSNVTSSVSPLWYDPYDVLSDTMNLEEMIQMTFSPLPTSDYPPDAATDSDISSSHGPFGILADLSSSDTPPPRILQPPIEIVQQGQAWVGPTMSNGQVSQMANGTLHNSTTPQQYQVERSSSTQSSNYSAPSSNQPQSNHSFNQQSVHTFNNDSIQASSQSKHIASYDQSVQDLNLNSFQASHQPTITYDQTGNSMQPLVAQEQPCSSKTQRQAESQPHFDPVLCEFLVPNENFQQPDLSPHFDAPESGQNSESRNHSHPFSEPVMPTTHNQVNHGTNGSTGDEMQQTKKRMDAMQAEIDHLKDLLLKMTNKS